MDAPTDPSEPTRETIAEAARWQAHLADEHCTDVDRAALEGWLAADPTNRIAFERMAAMADRLAGQPEVERTALKRMIRRKPGRNGALVLLLAGLSSAFGWWASGNQDVRTRFADERTAIGEQRPVRLASGDTITLDSDTAADVDDGGRSIRLWRGAIMADIREGSAQPFMVRTGQGTARAMGTRYSVRVSDDATVVVVIESRVKACASRSPKRCATLAPGEAARLDANGLRRLPDADTFAAEAWAQGILYAEDRPLASVLAELNRYRADPIRYDAAALSGLAVSGSFSLGDTDRALASIARALPVTVQRRSGTVTVSRR